MRLPSWGGMWPVREFFSSRSMRLSSDRFPTSAGREPSRSWSVREQVVYSLGRAAEPDAVPGGHCQVLGPVEGDGAGEGVLHGQEGIAVLDQSGIRVGSDGGALRRTLVWVEAWLAMNVSSEPSSGVMSS